VKFLLTSAGIKNASIENALVGLLGKPISECVGLCIPTAIYAFPGGTDGAWRMINGRGRTPLVEVGWKSVGVLELTTLPSIDRDVWLPALEGADALLVFGGDSLYLSHWVRESGLAELLPSLGDKVWLGVSGGSMALAPSVGEQFHDWKPPSGEDRGLGLVDFSIFPHLDHPDIPENSMAKAEIWAAGLGHPGYAIDDQTAIRVVDGQTDVAVIVTVTDAAESSGGSTSVFVVAP
jgi:dipeptidase E